MDSEAIVSQLVALRARISDLERLEFSSVGPGGGAPANAEYVTLAANAVLTQERILTAGQLLDLVDSGSGAAVTLNVTLHRIVIISSMTTTEYPADDTGLAAAIAAYCPGNVLLIAPGTYTGNYTLPAHSTVRCSGETIFTGQIIASDGTLLVGATIARSAASGTLAGLVAPATGSTNAVDCRITVDVTDGNARAVQTAAGTLTLWNCHLSGTSLSSATIEYIYPTGYLLTGDSRLVAPLQPGDINGNNMLYAPDGWYVGLDSQHGGACGVALTHAPIVLNSTSEIYIIASNRHGSVDFVKLTLSISGTVTLAVLYNHVAIGAYAGETLSATALVFANGSTIDFDAIIFRTDRSGAPLPSGVGVYLSGAGGTLNVRGGYVYGSASTLSAGTGADALNFSGVDEGAHETISNPGHNTAGAWDTVRFASDHARDISLNAPTVHLPLPSLVGGVAVSDGTKWVIDATLPISSGGTGAATFANHAVLIGPLTGGPLAPTVRTIDASDLPASTVYGSGSPGDVATWVTDTHTLTHVAVSANQVLGNGGTGLAGLAVTAPLVVVAGMGYALTVQAADGSNNGYLSNTDYTLLHGLPTGSGVAGQVAAWSATGVLTAANLIGPANILTITDTAASTLALAISAGKTLTLTSTDNYGLTIGATSSISGTAIVGTPGTLTASTTNAAADPHTHAVTSSSNPGAAASLLASAASGILSIGAYVVTNPTGAINVAGDLHMRNVGAELVTGDSSTFTGGVGNWVTWYGGATIAASGGKGVFTTSGVESGIYLNPTGMVAGQLYTLKIKIRQASGSAGILKLGSGFPGISITGITGAEQTFTKTNVVVGTYLGIFADAGQSFEIDDISLTSVSLGDIVTGGYFRAPGATTGLSADNSGNLYFQGRISSTLALTNAYGTYSDTVLYLYGPGNKAHGMFCVQSSSTYARGTLGQFGFYSFWNMDNSGNTFWSWGARYDGTTNAWVRDYTTTNNWLPYIKYGTAGGIGIGGATANDKTGLTPTMADLFTFDVTASNPVASFPALTVTGKTDRQQLAVTGNSAAQAQASPLVQFARNDTASGLSEMLRLSCLGSGAANDGGYLALRGKDSTTADVSVARVSWQFVSATHATKTGRGFLSAFDWNAERTALTWEADGTAARLGFLGAAAVVQQTGCAVPTDLATAIAAITALRTALNAYGLTTVV